MKPKILLTVLSLTISMLPLFARGYTATFRNTNLQQTIDVLKKTTGHDFVYAKSILKDGNLRVNGSYSEVSLNDLLDKTIAGQLNLAYKIEGNTIALIERDKDTVVKTALMTGTVVDEAGDPLPGVTVRVKGVAGQGAITDVNGNFSLKTTEDPCMLSLSYVGMEPAEVMAYDNKPIRVCLASADNLLDQVVVTGYQTISKERSAGSFVKVDTKDLKSQNITSVDDILDGHVAGYSEGRIRGITSMNGITTPLYVIDGFPVESTRVGYSGGAFQDTDPSISVDDIESITVLKDAAAASIYGARAANGVIVITTKKAQKGKVTVSASATYTTQPYKRNDEYSTDSRLLIAETRDWISQNPNFTRPDVVSYAENILKNTKDMAPHMKAIYKRYAGQMTEAELNSLLDKYSTMGRRYYDEADALQYRAATTQRYNLNIATSSERSSLVTTLAYYRNDEHRKDSWRQGFEANLRGNIKVANWLDIDLGTSVIYENSNTPSYSLYNPGFTIAPYMSLYNEDGSTIVSKMEDRIATSRLNAINKYGLYSEDIDPIDELNQDSGKNTSNLTTRLYGRLNFKFTSWLKFTSQIQYEFGNHHSKELQDKDTYAVKSMVNGYAKKDNAGNVVYQIPYGDIYQHGINDQRAYNFRNQIEFDNKFAELHQITAIAGIEMRHNKARYESHYLYGYDEDMLTYGTIDQNVLLAATDGLLGRTLSLQGNKHAWIRESINRYFSWYGNMAYAYDSKYILNASIRSDRTNLYGTSSKYQGNPIWSTGVAWRMDRENFIQDITWINMLKLRFSYGIGGNIAKNRWPYTVAYYNNNTKPGIGGLSGTISSRPNPNLRWEKTTTTNVGVDFSLLNNRINGTVEYYNKKGTDLLAATNGVSVEGQGYTTNVMNNGEVTNRGVEISLNGDAVRIRDWTWNLQLVYGYNHSRVDKITYEPTALYLLRDYPEAYPRVGYPLNTLYGYKWAGLTEEGIPQVYNHDGEIYSAYAPQSVDDYIYLGSSLPTYNGSFTSNLRYKGFTLSAMLYFMGGHVIKCPQYTYDDRWKEPGDEKHTDVPRYVASENKSLPQPVLTLYTQSSAIIRDASHIKVRNIALTYTLPSGICSKFSAKEVSAKFAMENVATFAKSKLAKYNLNGFQTPNYVFSLFFNF